MPSNPRVLKLGSFNLPLAPPYADGLVILMLDKIKEVLYKIVMELLFIIITFAGILIWQDAIDEKRRNDWDEIRKETARRRLLDSL